MALADDGALKRGAFQDLSTWHGHLVALVRRNAPRTRLHGKAASAIVVVGGGAEYLVYVRKDGHWERVGAPIHGGQGQVLFGASSSATLTLGVTKTQDAGTARYVERLTHGRKWKRSGGIYRAGGLGPTLTGPARVGARVSLPVVDADRAPWRYYAITQRKGRWRTCCGGALNQSKGNAQGGLYNASGAAWALWQEDRQRSDGLFDTGVYVGRLNRNRAAVQRLWQGPTIGPGPLQVVGARGGSYAIYPTSGQPPGQGLSLEVRRLHVR